MKVRNLYLKQLKTASKIFCCRFESYVKDKKKITFVPQFVFFFYFLLRIIKYPKQKKDAE